MPFEIFDNVWKYYFPCMFFVYFISRWEIPFKLTQIPGNLIERLSKTFIPLTLHSIGLIRFKLLPWKLIRINIIVNEQRSQSQKILICKLFQTYLFQNTNILWFNLQKMKSGDKFDYQYILKSSQYIILQKIILFKQKIM